MFLLKGGSSIQLECDNYVRRYGKVLPGNAMVSEPGQLPCKMIIHAVGPEWKGGTAGEPNALFDAVCEALNLAGNNNMQSLAIPAISTGIFGYPLGEAIVGILDAIWEYFKEGNKLPSEVHLVDNDARTVNIFHETLLAKFGESNVQVMGVANTEGSLPVKRQVKTSKFDTDFQGISGQGILHLLNCVIFR